MCLIGGATVTEGNAGTGLVEEADGRGTNTARASCYQRGAACEGKRDAVSGLGVG